jgi:hypothetical protein
LTHAGLFREQDSILLACLALREINPERLFAGGGDQQDDVNAFLLHAELKNLSSREPDLISVSLFTDQRFLDIPAGQQNFRFLASDRFRDDFDIRRFRGSAGVLGHGGLRQTRYEK